MSGVYIYTDTGDQVSAERSRVAGEFTVRIGTVTVQMWTDKATELHAALGSALAATPADQEGGSAVGDHG
jgi:hypothetical protein